MSHPGWNPIDPIERAVKKVDGALQKGLNKVAGGPGGPGPPITSGPNRGKYIRDVRKKKRGK